MRILSLYSIIYVSVSYSNQQTESPHGSDFKISCKTCHSPKGWKLDKDVYSFNHNKTKLPTGWAACLLADCRQCHPTLVFKRQRHECSQCHTDVHQSTTGLDCHGATLLHHGLSTISTRFTRGAGSLCLGPTELLIASDAISRRAYIRFDVLGINCVDCHRNDYWLPQIPIMFSRECRKIVPFVTR